MALGIDIYSRFQSVTNWQAVKDHGVTFVFVKLTDGGGLPNGGRNTGDALVAGARSVGIPVGGYHFAQASPSPEAQADVFVAEVRRLGATGCVPMLDLEDNPPGSGTPNIPDGRKRDFSIRFCGRVAGHGFRPGVYLNNALAKMLRPDQFGVPDLVIWIARYGAKPDAAAGRYDVHQYSDSGQVPGIRASGVDLNESYTNAHLTGGGAAPKRKATTELMERRTIPASPSTTSVRLFLSGSETAAIIVRPRVDGDGVTDAPVWQGNIYAWGSDKVGVGGNPLQTPGFDPKTVSHRRYHLPGAVWVDFEYSSNVEFEIDIVG
ncbi:glycoside hydrolase family 25 protein [Amycolatopsis decaplanina]|uniref:glycoside hydrolase family 25 protein n=1 Tax=Amycolatopsis decaplanina TaxID=208441 RepID=UPI00228406CE|nr:glycoside hydrolase family 25 protein [Amycolatopsis decaplanina]